MCSSGLLRTSFEEVAARRPTETNPQFTHQHERDLSDLTAEILYWFSTTDISGNIKTRKLATQSELVVFWSLMLKYKVFGLIKICGELEMQIILGLYITNILFLHLYRNTR